MAQNGLTFSHAVGYRGLARIDGETVLCTGGNINLTQDPIMGSGVWGAGYKNIAPIAWAWNYLQLEGSINYELVASMTLWDKLNNVAISNRAKSGGYPFTLFPDGKNGFNGKAWVSSLSFDASEGQAVTGTVNFKGDPSQNNAIIATGEGDNSATGLGGGTVSQFTGPTIVPYWRTSVNINDNATDEKDIISWNCTYNSDLQLLKCCNIDEDNESPLSADYIMCGEATADGTYTIFKIQDSFKPGAYHQKKTNLKFKINMGTEATPGSGYTGAIYNSLIKSLKIPYALVNSGSTAMATGASYITSEFSFTGVGDGINAIVSMDD